MNKSRWLQIIREMMEEIGYPAENVATALKALEHGPDRNGQQLLSTTELSKFLGVSRVTLWRMQLPSLTVGRCKRYELNQVLARLAHNVNVSAENSNGDVNPSNPNKGGKNDK